MDRVAIELMFALLRSAICDTQLQENEKKSLNDEKISKILSFSKKQDISHLIAYALNINALLMNENKSINDKIFKAVYYYERLNNEYEKICNILENEQICFIPLKGSVIREFYPKPWMRTSCDIDILIYKADMKKATECLVNNYGYSRIWKSSHDVSFLSENKNHIELHFNLLEETLFNKAPEVLQGVWQTSTLYKSYSYRYEMSDEMFYFYHIAHMAKHFEGGGCGIKPFIDLWLLDNVKSGDRKERDELLEKGGLLKFANIARQLSRVWFENIEHTEITKQMEQYVLAGGVYGSIENSVKLNKGKQGGKNSYILSRVFQPYKYLKLQYPCLIKHKWLTPFCEVHRWFKLVFKGRTKRLAEEIKYNSNISKNESENMQNFLKNIGLL